MQPTRAQTITGGWQQTHQRSVGTAMHAPLSRRPEIVPPQQATMQQLQFRSPLAQPRSKASLAAQPSKPRVPVGGGSIARQLPSLPQRAKSVVDASVTSKRTGTLALGVTADLNPPKRQQLDVRTVRQPLPLTAESLSTFRVPAVRPPQRQPLVQPQQSAHLPAKKVQGLPQAQAQPQAPGVTHGLRSRSVATRRVEVKIDDDEDDDDGDSMEDDDEDEPAAADQQQDEATEDATSPSPHVPAVSLPPLPPGSLFQPSVACEIVLMDCDPLLANLAPELRPWLQCVSLVADPRLVYHCSSGCIQTHSYLAARRHIRTVHGRRRVDEKDQENNSDDDEERERDLKEKAEAAGAKTKAKAAAAQKSKAPADVKMEDVAPKQQLPAPPQRQRASSF